VIGIAQGVVIIPLDTLHHTIGQLDDDGVERDDDARGCHTTLASSIRLIDAAE
jgi:hypothetical protein